MTRPQWELARGSDAVEYYEAMSKRFPPNKKPEVPPDGGLDGEGLVRVNSSHGGNDLYLRKSAGLFYVYGLIAAKRQDDAIRFAIEEEVDFRGISWLRHEESDLEMQPLDVFRFAQALLQKEAGRERVGRVYHGGHGGWPG